MDIGKLFKDAWGLFVKDLGPLVVGMLIASVIPAVAGFALGIATFGVGMSGLDVNEQGDVTNFSTQSWVILIVGVVAIVVALLFLSAPLYAGLLSGVIRRVREGREMGYGDAFAGFRIFGRVIWACILLTLVYLAVILTPTAVIVAGAVAGSGVLVAVGVIILLPALALYAYLMVAWVYLFPVIVDRDAAVMPSLGESRSLVHGSGWWWTFLVLIVLQLAVGAAGVVLGMVPFVGSLAMIVVYPFMLTYIVAMYFQARGEGWQIDGVLAAPAAQQWVAPPTAPPTGTPYPPPPAPPADASAWKVAADPLAALPPSSKAAEPHVHQAPAEDAAPTVDGASGKLRQHCSQCGALIGSSEEFCQACALEVSGGEPAGDDRSPIGPASDAPTAPEAPQPPQAPAS